MGRLGSRRLAGGVRRIQLARVGRVDAVDRVERIEDRQTGQHEWTGEEHGWRGGAGHRCLQDAVPFDDDFGILSECPARGKDERHDRKRRRELLLICAHDLTLISRTAERGGRVTEPAGSLNPTKRRTLPLDGPSESAPPHAAIGVAGGRKGVGEVLDVRKIRAYAAKSVEAQESPEVVRQSLERVLSSAGFARNDRQSKFLRFVVEQHLDGRDGELKESVLAVEVFGRNPGYDPKLDGIVRTEAMRLRARLDKYYAVEGRQDPLVIELPKGGYRPVFRARASVAPPPQARMSRSAWIAASLAAVAIVTVTGIAWWWIQPLRGPASVTVAVLPLENLAHGEASDYFADGLTDEIIRHLSVVEGLTVPSRTSSFALKGKLLNAADAGKELGADYLVEGSVMHAGDRLRVTVALVRVRDDARLWSERFDRKSIDVFAIQDEISRGIANALRLRVGSGGRRYETNLEAYDLYLRGRHLMASFPTRGRPIAKPAIDYFDQAIARDPSYAIAYAGMADAFLAIERNMGAESPLGRVGLTRAKAAAERALDLDPMLSEAHSAVASVRAREYAWQDAESGFRRAIELNPNNALARLELGEVLVVQERFDEGLQEMKRAAALDPLSPYVNTEFASALVMSGRYPEAIDRLRHAIALDPSRTRPHNVMGRALYLQGNTAEAQAVFDEVTERWAPRGGPDWVACAEVHAGQPDKARTLLQQQVDENVGPRRLAWTSACLGDEERTLDLLEKAVAQREPGVPEMLRAPELAWMRTSVRLSALHQQLNLTP